jgi:hypothetical protein
METETKTPLSKKSEALFFEIFNVKILIETKIIENHRTASDFLEPVYIHRNALIDGLNKPVEDADGVVPEPIFRAPRHSLRKRRVSFVKWLTGLFVLTYVWKRGMVCTSDHAPSM